MKYTHAHTPTHTHPHKREKKRCGLNPSLKRQTMKPSNEEAAPQPPNKKNAKKEKKSNKSTTFIYFFQTRNWKPNFERKKISFFVCFFFVDFPNANQLATLDVRFFWSNIQIVQSRNVNVTKKRIKKYEIKRIKPQRQRWMFVFFSFCPSCKLSNQQT